MVVIGGGGEICGGECFPNYCSTVVPCGNPFYRHILQNDNYAFLIVIDVQVA